MSDRRSETENVISASTPGSATEGRLDRTRRLLAALVATTDMDPESAAYLQMASAELLDTPHPPMPMPPQDASTDIHADLATVLELLSAEAMHAAPTAECVRLAIAYRHVEDALTRLQNPIPSAASAGQQ